MGPRSLAVVLAVWSASAAACAADEGDVPVSMASPAADVDTTATELSGEGPYCGDRTGTGLIEEAGALTGSPQPETEAAWVMTWDGLAELDRELAQARTGGDTQVEEVFVVPVADGSGDRLDPQAPTVQVDERIGHTAVVALDCTGGRAIRLLPDGFFPFGQPSEFLDRTRWFTEWTAPNGRPATNKEISDLQWEADAHCAWPNVRMIFFGGNQYVRDPDRVFDDWPFETTLDLDTSVPSDAVDTGYRNGDVELWVSAPDGPTSAYLVGPDTTERWPRPTDPIHCA